MVCVGFALSELVLRDLWWFCVIWAGSTWSELVLHDLNGFCLICYGSVWSVMVLCYLHCFCMIWAGSAWIICDGFVWSVLVLRYLSWCCVICDGSVWSELVLHDLNGFCLICYGSVWSKLIQSDLWWFWMIWAIFAWYNSRSVARTDSATTSSRFSWILPENRALLQKFCRRSNLPKCGYYGRDIILNQFIKFVWFWRNSRYGGFGGSQTWICQNWSGTCFGAPAPFLHKIWVSLKNFGSYGLNDVFSVFLD